MIYRFVPGFGDEIANARNNRKQAADGAQAAAVISSPAALVAAGHQDPQRPRRQQRRQATSAAGGARPSNPVSGGVAAHSSRGTGRTEAADPAALRRTRPPRRSPATPRHAGNDRNSRQQPHGR